jgi:hypothetical protein
MRNNKGYKVKTGDKQVAQMSSSDRERRKVLWEIINTPGYDPNTVREAQRLWIQMQKSQVKGV